MQGNLHVPFLGGWVRAILPGYPAHLPVANENNILQRQEASEAGMVAEGCELGRIRGAVSGAAMQHIKPHRQPPIASG
jgi:hypothetical protein